MGCEKCVNYSFYLMITSGPYQYYGDVPCLRCSRYNKKQDLFKERKQYNCTCNTKNYWDLSSGCPEHGVVK